MALLAPATRYIVRNICVRNGENVFPLETDLNDDNFQEQIFYFRRTILTRNLFLFEVVHLRQAIFIWFD